MNLHKYRASVPPTGKGKRVRGLHVAVASISLAAFLMTGCGGSNQSKRTAVFETDLGSIKIELLEDESPKTVENFRLLAERGYYDGTIFHRVVSGFMIQGGDPKGNGSGGETATGAPLPNEIDPRSPLYQGGYKRGMVAMANKGKPETGSSQFFIMHGDRSSSQLPLNYTIFGRVTEGMDVVDRIAAAPTTNAPNGEKSRPVTPVKTNRIYLQ